MAKLRILATTDLHGHLLPYDYVKDQPTQSGGLAGLATLIKDARAEAATQNMHVLLLDNGDTFQGTPLATHLANGKVGPDHPIVASFNHLQFDALGLGNHDLDHGLPYLKAVASAVEIPFLSSNLKGADLSPLRSNLLLDINVGTDPPAPLKVGILSVLPEQSAAWNSHHLGPCADIIDPVQSLSAQAEALRKEGADLIVILAHMGVGHDEGSDNRAAQALAETGNVDALILGHTHRRFPSTDYAERRGVDIQTSTVGHVPAVMAGHGGSDLAVMDLQLSLDKRLGWKIDSHRCTLRVNDASVAPDPTICALAKGTHDAATALMNKPLATIPRDLHSYFSLAAPAPTQLLTARAHFNLVQSALAGTADAALPLLATSAAHGAGGAMG